VLPAASLVASVVTGLAGPHWLMLPLFVTAFVGQAVNMVLYARERLRLDEGRRK
jgi:hypothetical protein